MPCGIEPDIVVGQDPDVVSGTFRRVDQDMRGSGETKQQSLGRSPRSGKRGTGLAFCVERM